MTINPIKFGYTTTLSKLWKEGKLPEVVKGFYGDILSHDPKSPQYATNEHLQPHSKGGKTSLYNIVLSSAENNNRRGNDPLTTVFDKHNAEEYLKQFEGLKVEYKKGNKIKMFNGDSYAENIRQTIKQILNREGSYALADSLTETAKQVGKNLDIVG
jgi:hypothetical protein